MKIIKTYENFIGININEGFRDKIKNAIDKTKEFFTGKARDISVVFNFLVKEKAWIYNLLYLEKIGMIGRDGDEWVNEKKKINFHYNTNSFDPEKLSKIKNEIDIAIKMMGKSLTGFALGENKTFELKRYPKPEMIDIGNKRDFSMTDKEGKPIKKTGKYGYVKYYGMAPEGSLVENLTHSELKDFIIKIYENKQATGKPSTPFIWGLSGFGKTDTVEAASDELGIKCLTWLLSTCSPEEIKGATVPDHKTKTAKTYLPEIFPNEDDTEGGILFFDEVNRAHPQTINAALQLLLDHKLDNYVLPRSWIIVCAGNWSNESFNEKDVEGMDQNVEDLDVAAKTRLGHINLCSSSEEFLDYATDPKHKLHPWIIQFITFYKDFLHKPTAVTVTFPNPRNWEAFSDDLDNLIEDRREKKMKLTVDDIIKWGSATLSEPIAILFANFVKLHKSVNLKDAEKVFTDPMKAPMYEGKWSSDDLYGLCQLIMSIRPPELNKKECESILTKSNAKENLLNPNEPLSPCKPEKFTERENQLLSYIENLAKYVSRYKNRETRTQFISVCKEQLGQDFNFIRPWMIISKTHLEEIDKREGYK